MDEQGFLLIQYLHLYLQSFDFIKYFQKIRNFTALKCLHSGVTSDANFNCDAKCDKFYKVTIFVINHHFCNF